MHTSSGSFRTANRPNLDCYRGKTRLAKWYAPYSDEEKIKLKGEVRQLSFYWLPFLPRPESDTFYFYFI